MNIWLKGRDMIAVGIDLGGTKIEAQVFDADWAPLDARRVPTPLTYDALIDDITALVDWAQSFADHQVSVGIGSAGLVNTKTGTVTAANLPSHGKPFAADVANALGRSVTFLNDSQAMALSEAVFGAGRGYDTMLALVLGTGVSGALVANGLLQHGCTQTLGEFGHIAAPAHLVQAHGLPLVACGCGQIGCVETLLSGAGLMRIAAEVMGEQMSPEALIEKRANDQRARKVWDIWCALAADLIRTLTRTTDPHCIVLGGGLSQIHGIAEDLTRAAQAVQFAGFDMPPILLAQGGDTSGARGAAYHAVMCEARNV
ncbi:MAG: ROK family protein [Yoonia sp.]|uniref:ROK family protein n=1 Tax=Yoonia sp. TaxID=2212373 RepID=UPI00273ED710|nr:ROK family protein [Yoonia sp.]MDP5085719.1 ROK family protein [Yoonia sp.]